MDKFELQLLGGILPITALEYVEESSEGLLMAGKYKTEF